MDDRSRDHLGEALRLAVSRFVRGVRAAADSMPESRAETLAHLERHGPQSMSALAAARGVTQQSVSRMVGDLERTGLVRRQPNLHDARAFLISISAAGRAALRAERQGRRRLIDSAIDATLDDPDRALLLRLPALLDRITSALDDRPSSAPNS